MILRQAKILIRGLIPWYVGLQRQPSWQDAIAGSLGYSHSTTVQRTLDRRHSADFSNQEIVDDRMRRVAKAIQLAGIASNTELSILDVGGGWGDYFWGLQRLLNCKLNYTVVETEELIHQLPVGLTAIENLTFSSQLPQSNRFDIVLLSSVLQYVQDPWRLLRDASCLSEFVIINRLLLVPEQLSGFAVQRSGFFRRVSYPIHLLSEQEFLIRVQNIGSIISRWQAPEDTAVIKFRLFSNQGFLLKTLNLTALQPTGNPS